MNVQKIAAAMIIALAYEMLLKAVLLISPSLPVNPIVSKITSILSLAVAVTIVLFLVAFLAEERKSKMVVLVLKVLIGFMLLNFVLKLSAWSTMVGFEVTRLAHEAIGFGISVLLFLLVIGYRATITDGWHDMKRGTVLVAVMLAIGILRSAVSLAEYARFTDTGSTSDFPPVFYAVVALLFFVTRASMIYFLYCYYQMKSAKGGSRKGGPAVVHTVQEETQV
jgi:hypothetical protein